MRWLVQFWQRLCGMPAPVSPEADPDVQRADAAADALADRLDRVEAFAAEPLPRDHAERMARLEAWVEMLGQRERDRHG